MEDIKKDKNSLRKYGLIMALAFMIISSIFYVKHGAYLKPTIIISLLFFVCALTAPQLLKNPYAVWMRFTYVLAWVNTRIILTLIFFLVFTPIGFIIRLLGKDLLDLKIKENVPTYWRKKNKKEFKKEDYYRQF